MACFAARARRQARTGARAKRAWCCGSRLCLRSGLTPLGFPVPALEGIELTHKLLLLLLGLYQFGIEPGELALEPFDGSERFVRAAPCVLVARLSTGLVLDLRQGLRGTRAPLPRGLGRLAVFRQARPDEARPLADLAIDYSLRRCIVERRCRYRNRFARRRRTRPSRPRTPARAKCRRGLCSAAARRAIGDFELCEQFTPLLLETRGLGSVGVGGPPALALGPVAGGGGVGRGLAPKRRRHAPHSASGSAITSRWRAGRCDARARGWRRYVAHLNPAHGLRHQSPGGLVRRDAQRSRVGVRPGPGGRRPRTRFVQAIARSMPGRYPGSTRWLRRARHVKDLGRPFVVSARAAARLLAQSFR